MVSTIDETVAEQRARREQRRALQGAQNKLRAKEMHAARFSYEASLAPMDGRAAILAGRGQNPQDYVGCSGWFYGHWADNFYPAELPRNR